MMAKMHFTILGCGSSGGVPRIGNIWGNCDPENPKNRRQRCSMLVERVTDDGTTSVLIDTTPDMRNQLLEAGVSRLDAVVYTHSHADHTHGLDDLRMIVINMRQRLPVWADGATQNDLISRFGYAFIQPEGSPYPPILEMNTIDGDISIDGPGGTIVMHPFAVEHGSIDSLGLRIGGLAYLPDVIDMDAAAWQMVQGLDVWILDALKRTPHPTHLHFEKALEWIAHARPKRAVLTNMHVDMDYAAVDAETPEHITPAYDGMTITLPA